MVNDLKQLLRDNVADAPTDHLDTASLVAAGRRRVRVRRTRAAGGTALLAAGVVTVALLGGGPAGREKAEPAHQPPRPDAPTLRLADAQQAVEERDYEVLTSHTNKDLDADNGQYLDGVTDDGLVLFRDGPRSDQLYPRFALLDPSTGAKDWLPDLAGIGQDQTWPVDLGTDRLVLLSLENGLPGAMRAHVFDRASRQWTTLTWSGLPGVEFPRAVAGPDDRLYVSVPATQGTPPEGGWPTGPDGEADDADAEGDTYDLWSVSMTDTSDVRDEHLTVGELAFTDTKMVWSDSGNGAAGRFHVRDLATGVETSFDPHLGDKCNLLGFGATGDRIVASEYCGTYDGGVRDDRVQILSTDGEQVVTIQDSGAEGYLPPGGGVVVVTAFRGDQDTQSGAYVYDLATNRFLRISDAVSNYGTGGAPGDQFFWHTPVNHRHGATQWLGKLLR
ncbi:hypothetical protein [Nocardioides conyzicola]|uniref:WD40 repeat domain-containing protein n=1 Tax=Nocardioides conyzicola TaxID=1651781 RepID=A0ABP8X392_9ACTN